MKTKIEVDNHIHIVSDEPIKYGDYWIYIHKFKNIPQDYTITKNNLPESWFEKLWDKSNYKKVIASTDKSLMLPNPEQL
jgi:hypothetical protein